MPLWTLLCYAYVCVMYYFYYEYVLRSVFWTPGDKYVVKDDNVETHPLVALLVTGC